MKGAASKLLISILIYLQPKEILISYMQHVAKKQAEMENWNGDQGLCSNHRKE